VTNSLWAADCHESGSAVRAGVRGHIDPFPVLHLRLHLPNTSTATRCVHRMAVANLQGNNAIMT
jgi:hypothetical protein